MRIAFIVIGNTRRSNFLNGHTLRYDKGSGSGTDGSTILVAEYLVRQGHEVVFAADKIDEPLETEYKKNGRYYSPGNKFYGVSYTNLNFDGIENKTFDILVSMLWFHDYNLLPIKVTKSFIYWSHLQWVYGTYNFIEYAKQNNLSVGLVHISDWEEKMNTGCFETIKNEIPNSVKRKIPNAIFDDLIAEIKQENIQKKKGKFIFHASWPRGGDVAVNAIRQIDIPNKELNVFDYLMVIHDHKDPFFIKHDGVDKKTLFRHLAESEYFIYPLYTPYQDVHKDTFACAVAEALAFGVIVITYPLGALPENFNDYCAWLPPPPNISFEKMQSEPLSKDLNGDFKIISNIIEKVNEIESNPELKLKLQTAASDVIINKYKIEEVGKMWDELINQLIDEKNKLDLNPQKFEVEQTQYELTNYHNNESAFFNVFRHDLIGYDIKQNKIWEPHLHILFEKYINKDSIVLEGGCHIGTHSVKLSKLSKKLYCFEPLKESFNLLEKNLSVNKCDNVEIFSLALSNNNEIVKFGWVPFHNLGGSGLDNNPMGIPNGNNLLNEKVKYDVQCTTIDSFNLEKLDFIKLDVEGYEPKVIEGAINTIKKFRPIIILESWKNHYGETDINDTKDKFKLLLDSNYSLEQVGISDWLFLPL